MCPMTGDGTIIARYVPQLSSQYTKMGLMIRESLLANAAHASLLVTPQYGGNVGPRLVCPFDDSVLQRHG